MPMNTKQSDKSNGKLLLNSTGIARTPLFKTSRNVLVSILVALTGIRITEVVALVSSNVSYLGLLIATLLVIVSLYVSPPQRAGKLLTRIGVIFIVGASFKQAIDINLCQGLVSRSKSEGGRYDLSNRVVVITGASSGVGQASAQLFASYGATVVMGCRSQQRCADAKEQVISALAKLSHAGNVVVGPALELGSLDSVWKFAHKLRETYPQIDILVNNAGGIAKPGERTSDGYETMFGNMHLGHFALTQWLLPALQGGSGLSQSEVGQDAIRGVGSGRVVWVSSEAFLRGSFHSSIMQADGQGDLRGEQIDNCASKPLLPWFEPLRGLALPCCPIGACPHTNAYARSKLANVLAAYELQKRSDQHASEQPKERRPRRIVTAVLHPGAVATNIHPLFSSSYSNWGMRSSLEAARLVVYAALEDSFVPGSYIDSMSVPHDLFGYFDSHTDIVSSEACSNTSGIARHIAAWPHASTLPFFSAAKTEITEIKRTAMNAAPPAGAQRSISFLKWALYGKTLLHDSTGPLHVGAEDIAAADLLPTETTRAEQAVALRMQRALSARLWEVSADIVRAYETSKK